LRIAVACRCCVLWRGVRHATERHGHCRADPAREWRM